MIVNERVRKVRLYKKLGTQELARLADVSPAAISKLETQARMPRLDTLQKLARAMDISVSFLVGETRLDEDIHVALAQESLEVYLRDEDVSSEERKALARISYRPSAPITANDWANLRANIAISRAVTHRHS